MTASGGASPRPRHIPVLLPEVLAALAPIEGKVFIDGTFGAGGYSRALLDAGALLVLALDRDPTAIAAGQELVSQVGPRLRLVETTFGCLEDAAREAGLDAVDGVVLDIGVSSMQIDEAARGFSFQSEGPLDMRMSLSGESAADFVNAAPEAEIARVLYELGEERRSRAIARAIVRAREAAPISTTARLAEIVSRAVGGRRGEDRHPATQTFQALRIHVNDELGELKRALRGAESILQPGGRLVVVSFHSLEDRIVKQFITARSGRLPQGSRHLPPQSVKFSEPSFRILNPRPLTPQKGELDANPRARSARLRAAVRTSAPPHADDDPAP